MSGAQQDILHRIDRLYDLVHSGPVRRMLSRPARYLMAWAYRLRLRYINPRLSTLSDIPLLWGGQFQILLPASFDLFIWGSKTHISELRYMQYLARRVKKGDSYLDIGAHFGFFSRFFNELSEGGSILAVEAASITFGLLEHNLQGLDNATAVHAAMSEENGTAEFHSFPPSHSEYNTLLPGQYTAEKWFSSFPPALEVVAQFRGDSLLKHHDFRPDLIKIDVEGAEELVVKGLSEYLASASPELCVEIKGESSLRDSYIGMHTQLINAGYHAHEITEEGETLPLKTGFGALLDALGRDSDNLIYRKEQS